MDFTDFFAFFKELSENNNRDWFTENKLRYLKIKTAFDQYIDGLIPKIREIDPIIGQLSAKDCVFRIYRDVRFSSNKDPYKTHMGAYLTQGGRKSKMAGYYLHFQPGQSFVAAGAYLPEANVLKEIRYEILDHILDFKKIIQEKKFVDYFSKIDGERLKTAPKGFPKDSEELELIKFKSYEIVHYFSIEKLNTVELDQYILELVAAALPYNQFMNRVIQHTLNNP